MQLPTPLCHIAGLAVAATTADLLLHLSTGQHDVLDGLLTSDEGRAAAEASLITLPKYRLRIEDQVGTLQSKYCSVNIENYPDPILVGFIADGRAENIPTELENLIFWAIIDDNLPWHSSSFEVGNNKCVNWRNLAQGKAIIAEPIDLNLDATNQQLISSLFGLSYPNIPSTAQPGALVSSALTIKLNRPLKRYTSIEALLLYEASSIQHPKWRFLSLYRILEHAYLTNIKEVLFNEFDQDASKAIESAQTKLKSEVSQLVFLADKSDAIAEFENFSNEMDALIAENNQYIIKLDRSAEGDALYRSQDAYKKAVLRFYKIRCSIAHAGTSSVIYEQFPDASSAILRLLPHVERIALKSLKITFI